ncbi:MAG: hypothetical protein ACOH2A_00600 [Sphingobacteriaceae bacterium]
MRKKLNFTNGVVWKWLLWIILPVVIIAALGGYYVKVYLSNRWKPILTEQLKKIVINSSDSLYRIEFSDLDLQLVSGNAEIKNFKLIPNMTVYEKMVSMHKAPDNMYSLQVEKLVLNSFKAKKAYLDNMLEIGSILIESPKLSIVNKRQPYNDTVVIKKSKTPYQLIKDIFKELHIGKISLKDVDFAFINTNEVKVKTTVLRNLNIDISDVFIDSLSQRDTSRFYNTKSVDFHLTDYRLATPDSLYYLNLKDIRFSTSRREIVLEKLSLDPRYDKVQFYKKVKYAKDRYALSFNRISLTQINLQKFLRSQQLHAGAMRISNGVVDVYNNNAYPKRVSIKNHAYPHQKLQEVALDMKIDSLYIEDTSISYAEADHLSGQTGKITFEKTKGLLLNVTNSTSAKKLNPYMTARLHTRFMNTADLNVNFKFNLLATNGNFNYSGTLGQMDGRVLNRITRPLGMVEVASANIKKLSFDVDADEHTAKGMLKFYYSDLKVQLLKREAGKQKLEKQSLISTLANTLVIRTNNPKNNGEFVSGSINYRRVPTASFFNFLWKGLLDGIKPSVGFDKRTENNITDVVTGASELLSDYKEMKRKNKIKRNERRKERAVKRTAKELKKGK